MFSRSLPRFALVGLLTAAFAAPAMTQEGGFQVPLNSEPIVPMPKPQPPEAPMPREAGDVMRNVHAYNFDLLRAELGLPALAPMPREREYRCEQIQRLRTDVYELVVMSQPVSPPVPPMTPPVPPVTDTKAQDHRQLFNFAVGLFGGEGTETPVPPMTPPAPPATAAKSQVPQTFNFGIGSFGTDEGFSPPVNPPAPCPTSPPFYHGPEYIMGSSRAMPVRPPAQPPVCGTFISSGAPITWSAVFPAVAPANGCCTGGVKVIELTAVGTCPVTAANPLMGTWYRDVGMAVIAVTFTRDEMKLCVTQREKGMLATITVTAHYTITKDGLVYGAVTGADVDVKHDSKADAGIGMELAELSLLLQELADRPFSFRAKATSAGLMVSQLKAASFEGISGKELAILGGLYKYSKDGQVPTPTAPKSVRTGRCDAEFCPADYPIAAPTSPYAPPTPLPTSPLGEPIQRVGVDFGAPVMAPPYVVTPWNPAPPCPAPPRPACDDPMKSMAAEAFGQMLRAGDKNWSAGMTLPSPRYLEHYPQYFAPDPAFPLPRELACQEAADQLRRAGASLPPAPIKTGAMGTWFRTIGAKQCVVKVEADHLTITVSEAHEEDGKTVVGHLTFTADYQLTRDGLTAVGLITSVDLKFDGEMPGNDDEAIMGQFGELQKALEDKPFALTLRRYGDALVIGNVRMPTAPGSIEMQPATYVGGRYTASVGPLPKLKPTKAFEPRPLPVCVPPALPPGAFGPYGPPVPPGVCLPPAGPNAYMPVPLPSGPYGPVALPPVFMTPAPAPAAVCPQPYLAPPASAPSRDLLPPQAMPVPSPVRPVDVVVPVSRPSESRPAPAPPAPVQPVPTMPQPRPLSLDIGVPAPPSGSVIRELGKRISLTPVPIRGGIY